jgi:pimeloyl-ACP methyl ester carboxylesterase
LERAYVMTRDGQLHYITAGEGEPLLLLHQTPFSSEEYVKLIPLLAPHFRVIALDTPGYGMSDAPPREYEIADYATAAQEFLVALSIPQAHVFGHHTGASIACEMAAAFPDTVSKVIMSGCPVYSAEERIERLHRYPPFRITEDGSYMIEKWNRYKQTMPHAGPEGWHKFVTATMIAGERGEEAHHAVFRYDSLARLPQIKCPTLLLYGSDDIFRPRLEATLELVPGARTAIVEGARSLVALEAPEGLAAAILEFLH